MKDLSASKVFSGVRVLLDLEHGGQLLMTSPVASGDHLAVVVVFEKPHWYISVHSTRTGQLLSRFRTHFEVHQIYHVCRPGTEDCIVAIEGSAEYVQLEVGLCRSRFLLMKHCFLYHPSDKVHLLARTLIGEGGS